MTEPPAGPLGSDPLATAQALQNALEGMTRQLSQVQAAVRRGRRIILALAASLVLDVSLTAAVSVAAVQAHSASTRANATVSELHAAQVSSCQAANQTRAQEVRLWVHLAQVSSPEPGLTPKQKAQGEAEVTALLAYVKAIFAPRDCQAAYRLPGGQATGQRRGGT
jgi:hypothetical protein